MSTTSPNQGALEGHKKIERNVTLLAAGTLLTVAIGGMVEIAPLFWIDNTIEQVEGMRPYTPLEQAGRDIYIREGCYVCHSQMIRPMRDEVERYGHYSLAAESKYDHPFQWGSKRTGPDLARVGGRYSDEWHQDHFYDAKSVVPESVMPPYGFLFNTVIDGKYIQDVVKTHAIVGVPYDEAMVENAQADMQAQANPDADTDGLQARYGSVAFEMGKDVNVRKFDGQPELTEADALIAYIQVLGTMVDFSTFIPDPDR